MGDAAGYKLHREESVSAAGARAAERARVEGMSPLERMREALRLGEAQRQYAAKFRRTADERSGSHD